MYMYIIHSITCTLYVLKTYNDKISNNLRNVFTKNNHSDCPVIIPIVVSVGVYYLFHVVIPLFSRIS